MKEKNFPRRGKILPVERYGKEVRLILSLDNPKSRLIYSSKSEKVKKEGDDHVSQMFRKMR